MLLLEYLELFKLNVLLSPSFSFFCLYYLFNHIHLLFECFLVLQSLEVFIAIMIACDYLLFFEVLIPLLTFKRLSETLDDDDPIFGELPQSLYSLVYRVFFLQYGFQLLILQVLSRHKFDKMAAECFIVLPLLFVDFFLFLDDFFLVIAHYAPLDGLFLAFEEADHLLSRLHLLSLFLQISVNLLILLVDASNKSSFHKGLWLHFL